MLLYLFLLVSLPSVVVGQGGGGPPTPTPIDTPVDCLPPDPNDADKPSKYNCYAPRDCEETKVLVEVTTDFKLTSKCRVFLKFHAYANNWYNIIIESMQSLDETDKIEFKYNNLNDEIVVTCKMETDKISASYKHSGSQRPATVISIPKSDSGNLKCEFDVDLQLDITFALLMHQVTLSRAKAVVYKGTVSVATPEVRSPLFPNVFCRPSSLLDVREDIKEDKMYTKVVYDFGDIRCNDPNFKEMEFRKDGRNEKYEKIDAITCNRDHKYDLSHASGNKELEEDIDVRCVADADYFCNYDPMKTPDLINLEKTPPDFASKKKTEIGCPTTHRWFVVNRRKPDNNAKIRCKNYGGTAQWAYDTPDGSVMLSATGPPSHCLKEVDCHIVNSIKRENLVGSFLKPKNGAMVPSCQSEGTLKAKEGKNAKEDAVKDNEVFCNRTVGRYKYVDDATKLEKEATEDTIFLCEYPPRPSSGESKKINEANTTKMIISIPIAAGVALVVAVAVIALIIHLMKRKMKIANQKLLDAETLDSERFQPGKFKEQEEKAGKGLLSNDYLINDYLRKRRQDALITVKHTLYPGQVPVKTTENLLKEKGRENDDFRNNGIQTFVKTKFVRTAIMDEIDKILLKDADNPLPKHPRAQRSDGPELEPESDPADMEMKTQSEEKPEAKKSK